MTKRKCFLCAVLAIFFLLSLAACGKNEDYGMNVAPMMPEQGDRTTMHILNPDTEVRGIWIASVYNIDYPSRTDLSADELRAEIDAILDTCEKNSLNTVFFQVRPTCDALYQSSLFPVSAYLSSDGTLAFDPLGYLVTEAHKRNIYVHAWVNPLRVTMNSHDVSSLPDGSPVREHPEWTVPYADGKLYLNAGLPEVRQLVADGVEEIVRNYDVDGIVFDDYFYPYPTNDESGKTAVFDDADAYQTYGTDSDSLADWRRDNINRLVELCYRTVHETDPECVFGISPFAVWQNSDGTNGGSNTFSLEAYHSLYCDALAWIRGGYIDYISPQIYWTFDNKSAAFDVVTRWWNAQLEGSSVKLYVSHAAYRYEDGNWENPQGELTEQVSFARSEKYYRGSIFYGYDEINQNTNGASDELLALYEDEIIYTDIQSNGHGVTFSSPANGSSTTEKVTYILGMSDPYYMLTMNGERVSRTKSGFFSVYVTLEDGVNEFVFEQNGIRYLYTITCAAATAQAPAETEKADRVIDTLSVTGTYPSYAVTTSGSELWVSCVAAYGSEVTADIGGVVTALQALETPSRKTTDDGYIAVIYGGNAKLPEAAEGEVLEAGKVQYTARHADGTVTAEGIVVRVLGENAKLAVRVLDDYTHLKITESSSYYNDYTVQSAGMTDYVVSQRNGFYQLRMGGYVAETDVEETEDFPAELSVFDAAAVENRGETTEFQLLCEDRPAYNGCIEEDGRFVVTFYNVDAASAPEPDIGDNPLLLSCDVIRLEKKVRYAFTLYDVRNFYGFDLRYENGA
ncbi:MAG: glycoside hydrolase family 10 protein, partial [Eubacteriales bacterium]